MSVLTTGKLRRAIEELLENAIDHNPLEVSLPVDPRDETARLEIADNDAEIPEREVNVLAREYDVGPLYHGSGLGLWIIS